MANEASLLIAIIGCGAVSQRCHIPAVNAHPHSQLEWLVDPDADLLRRLSKDAGQVKTGNDYREVIGGVDAAILAVPHSLHAPIAVDLLRHGIHLLVEKPMAGSVAECDAMIEAADEGKAVLAVGLMRRFLHSAHFARWAVQSGLVGAVESFDFREGSVYSWPVQSDFFFRRETARGGVLFDTGAHTLDLLLWWLGEADEVEYYDDSYGGVEADCRVLLRMASGARGVVELSRTRNLRNTAIVRGEKAELEVGLRTNEAVVRARDGSSGLAGLGLAGPDQNPVTQGFIDLFPLQIDDWIEAIRTGRTPTVPGTEGRRSVALIEACYATRFPLELPWMSPEERGPTN
jgi:predicted dehydrogenase